MHINSNKAAKRLRRITVPAGVSTEVLVNSLRGYYYSFVADHFPGLKQLPAVAHVVLIWFVFNRGVSMGHEPEWRLAKEVDRRSECCELREDVKKEISSRSMLTLER